MRSTKTWTHYQETIDDDEDVVKWTYKCVHCVARELNCEEKVAWAHILEVEGRVRIARKRTVEFRAAYEDLREEWPALSKTGTRNLTRKTLKEVRDPRGSPSGVPPGPRAPGDPRGDPRGGPRGAGARTAL